MHAVDVDDSPRDKVFALAAMIPAVLLVITFTPILFTVAWFRRIKQ